MMKKKSQKILSLRFPLDASVEHDWVFLDRHFRRIMNFSVYPLAGFYGIKGMRVNTQTMVKTADTIFQPGSQSTAAEPNPLVKDRDTFLAYLLPIKKQLYNFVQKVSNFSSDADDLFQETVLKGFRYFHSFDPGKKFKTWIFTIAHNLMKDAFREKNLRHWPVSLDAAEDITVVDYRVSASLSTDVREIYSAAAQLKPRQREVFFLYYYNEFSVSEIAAITTLSRANIKFILHQARQTIKKILEVPE